MNVSSIVTYFWLLFFVSHIFCSLFLLFCCWSSKKINKYEQSEPTNKTTRHYILHIFFFWLYRQCGDDANVCRWTRFYFALSRVQGVSYFVRCFALCIRRQWVAAKIAWAHVNYLFCFSQFCIFSGKKNSSEPSQHA